MSCRRMKNENYLWQPHKIRVDILLEMLNLDLKGLIITNFGPL